MYKFGFCACLFKSDILLRERCMALIYHITTQAAWQTAQQQGTYSDPSLAAQGFIHLSDLDQVTRVANAIFVGQSGLALLEVETEQLEAPLKYEPPDTKIPAAHYTGELFPHLYGALNLDAVTRSINFAPSTDGDGTFQLPDELTNV
jgi:uncharacterized protein (DUF952 family)